MILLEYSTIKYNCTVLLCILLLCAEKSSYAQPGETKLYLRVFDASGKQLIYGDTLKNNFHIRGLNKNKKLGEKSKATEGTHNVFNGRGVNMTLLKRPLSKVRIEYMGKKMNIEIVNQPSHFFTMVIDTLFFVPGNFVLDCKKTKNNFSSRKHIDNSQWDITPGTSGLLPRKQYKKLQH